MGKPNETALARLIDERGKKKVWLAHKLGINGIKSLDIFRKL